MKVEDCIVTVERRSLGGCLDLAFVFTREFAGPIFRLWLVCALPSCVVVWLMASVLTDMPYLSIGVFLLFSAVFDALLVACMGPQVFGVPISVKSAIRAWQSRFGGWMLLTIVTRFFQVISGFCMVVPSVFVTAFAGHVPEVLLLEQASVNHVITRLNWLSASGGYARNLGRILSLFIYWAALSLGLFLMLDFLSTTLLNRPIFFSIMSQTSSSGWDLFLQLACDDPAVLTSLQLAAWLPYPLLRLAWFFCYLDQRIRNECWDLQLQFRAEASRLEAMS